MKKDKKIEEYKELYNVDELRDIYAKNVEYLDSKKELDKLKNILKTDIYAYRHTLEQDEKYVELKKQKRELDTIIDEYDELRATGHEMANGIEEFDNFTEEEIVDYFEKLKQYEILKKIIKAEDERIDQLVADYKQRKESLTKQEIEQKEQIVLEKGLKIVDIDAIKKEKKWKYDLEKINKMLIKNEYNDPYVRDEDWEKKDHSAQFIYNELLLDNWFGGMRSSDYDATQTFTYKKLSKNYPSMFEYFVNSLEKHTGKKYEKVTIITNETFESRGDYYDPNTYHVYGATILAPKEIAETLLMTEKKQTKESIQKLVEKHKDLILLNEENVCYYEDDYKVSYEERRKKQKFNETYRKEARSELKYSTESNQVETEKMFGIEEHDYNLDGEKIVKDLPSKEVANAIFDTLEYAKKLVRLAELEKIVNKRKKQQEAEEEYEELVKTM